MSGLAASAMFTSWRATKRRISSVVSPPSRAEAHLPAQVVSARLGRTYWASTARRSGKAVFLRRWSGEAGGSTGRGGGVGGGGGGGRGGLYGGGGDGCGGGAGRRPGGKIRASEKFVVHCVLRISTLGAGQVTPRCPWWRILAGHVGTARHRQCTMPNGRPHDY